MKKTLILLLVALFATHTVLADDISLEQALQIASKFADSPQTQQLSKRRASRMTAEPTLAYSVKSGVSAKDNVYVINLGNDQGFVIVSGEDGAEDVVLGYCDHGSFSYDDCPVQLKDLLTVYSTGVESLRQNPIMATTRRKAASATYPSYLGNVIVEPLLTTTWNQVAPYNMFCPEVTTEGTDLGNEYAGRYATGCVPTAVAQVMNYWKWPKESQGKVEDEDFSGHVYDWDNMLDNYGARYKESSYGIATTQTVRYDSYNAEQAEAVARLMADIGHAMGTAYGQPNGSPTRFWEGALIENFGYEPSCTSYGDVATLAEDLRDVLKAELDENRPVLYCGRPQVGDGHALVCDGYTSNNYFHFNYGWSGMLDGFYKLALLPKYSPYATIIIGLRPYDVEKIVVEGIQYALSKNGTAEIIDFPAGGMGVQHDVLEIPSTVEHEGTTYQVNRIRQRAFYRKGSIKKLIVGDNIEVIEPISFFYTRIDTVVLGDGIKAVPDEAFAYTDIRHLTIGKNVQRIGKKAFYLCYLNQGIVSKSPAFEVDDEAFANTRPKIGTWLNCITYMGRQAFAGARFSDRVHQYFTNLEVIGDSAFYGADFGTTTPSFRIYSKVREIAPSVFDGWNPVSTISVEEDNPYFSVEDAIGRNIYNKNKTTLLVSFRERPDGAYPSTLVKLAPRSMRPEREWKTIPATIVEMTGAYQDIAEISDPFKCLAVVPPNIPDGTFEGKISQKWGTLQVPTGTENAYHNAPGWRYFLEKWTWDDGIARGIIGNQAYNPLPAQEREYYMVVNGADGEQQRINIPVSEVSSMELSDDGKSFIIKRNGKDDVIATVASVDSITWMPGFVYENAEVFELNDSTLTVDAQKCSIQFDATCFDEDVQLCVRNSVLMPNALEGVVSGFTIDLSLSDGTHELSGTADIVIPVSVGEDETVHAAYYNEETGEWEPVFFTYDETRQTVVITTDHLSQFSIFTTSKTFSKEEFLNLIFESSPQLYTLNEAAKMLLYLCSSDDPEAQMVQKIKSEAQFLQSVGLDCLWNALAGIGEGTFGWTSDRLNNISTALGYLGIAVSILDVAAADIRGDDLAVASGTLSTVQNILATQAATAIGTASMTAAMSSVALIGIALNKFGTAAQNLKLDYLRCAYRYYYSKAGHEACGPQSKYKKDGNHGLGENATFPHDYYRTTQDWFDYFYPVFKEGKMNNQQLSTFIEQSVRMYCYRFWDDNTDATTWAYAYATEKGYKLGFVWDMESERQKISDEYYSDLMNGEIKSVLEAVRKKVKTEVMKSYIKAGKNLMAIMNTKVGIIIKDSECKKGETSQFAGWKIGFSQMPNKATDMGEWKKTINENGSTGLGWFTQYAVAKNEVPWQLTLYDEEDQPQKTFDLMLPNADGKIVVTIDLATEGVKVDTQHLDGLELKYDPASIGFVNSFWPGEDESDIPVFERETDGYMEGEMDVLNSENYRIVRLQTEVERFFNQHNYMTIDKAGNLLIGDEIVVTMNGNEGTGKFTIDVKYPFVDQTLDQFIKYFNNGNNGIWRLFKNILNGTIKHKIDCQVYVQRVMTGGDLYRVNFTGTGTFNMDVEGINSVSQIGIYNSTEFTNQDFYVKPENVTTGKVSGSGTVKLEYKTQMRATRAEEDDEE